MGGRRKQAEGRGCGERMVTTFHGVAEGVDREGEGREWEVDGGGKWMAATLYSVVPAVIVLADCGFLVAEVDGVGKWMAATLYSVVSPRAVLSEFLHF